MTRFTPLWLQSGSYAGSVDRRLLGALWPTPATSGMAVTVASGTTVNVAPGTTAVPTANNTGTVLCVSDAQEQVILPTAPASGSSRWDLVIARPRGTDLDGGGNNDFIFDYVLGTASATPPIPNAPAGTVALARVNRPGGSAAIVATDIVDMRLGDLSVPPQPFAPVRFRAYQAAQSIPRIVWTNMTSYAAPVENIGGGGFAGGVYTFPATGRYQIVACTMWVVPGGTAQWGLQQQYVWTPGGPPAAMSHLYLANPGPSNTMHPISLATGTAQAGQTVQLQLYNGHPSAAMSSLGGYGWLSVDRIG
jgi:hypothetical protein